MKKRSKIIAVVFVLLLSLSCLIPSNIEAAKTINYHEWLDTLDSMATRFANNKFKYRNAGTGTNGISFNAALKKGKRANCVQYVTWSMVEVGLITSSQQSWYLGGTSGIVYGSDKKVITGGNFNTKQKVNKKLSTLVSNGSIKPGDIIGGMGKTSKGKPYYHTMVFKEKKNGKYYFYSVGSNDGKVYTKNVIVNNTRSGSYKIGVIARYKYFDYTDQFAINTKATNGTISSSQKVSWKKDYTVTYKPNAGYKLKSVTVDGKNVTTSNPSSYKFSQIKSAHNIQVVYESIAATTDVPLKNYTITFNTNGGSSVKAITAVEKSKINKPDNPSKEGYTFEGWYSDSSLTKPYNFDIMPSSNITLFAKWKQNENQESSTNTNSYIITFNSNGGTSVSSISAIPGTKIAKPENPRKEGYTFEEWYSDSNLTKPYIFDVMPSNNLVLYAKWKPTNNNTYEIKVEAVDSTNKGLENLLYKLYSDSTCNTESRSGQKTNINGSTEFIGLEEGTYYVKQENQLSGYSLNSNNCQQVSSGGKVVFVNKNENTITIKAEDERGEIVQGAVFGIYQDKNCTLVVTDNIGNKITNVQTDNNGKAIINVDNYKDYYVKEEIYPDNYYGKSCLSINKKEEITIINKKVDKNKILVKEIDKYTNYMMDKVTVKVFKDEDCNEKIGEGITEEGQIVFDLNENKYFIKTENLPQGYKGENCVSTELSEENRTITVENTPYGDIKILKKDSKTNELVPNEKLRLLDLEKEVALDINENQVKDEITDSQGAATFKNIAYGDYYIEEVGSNAEPMKITLNNDNKNNLVIYSQLTNSNTNQTNKNSNAKIQEIITPDTASSTSIIAIIAGILLIFGGTGYLLYKKNAK